MKRILGLDLGTNSIGWALVDEAVQADEKSKIIKLGVRVIQYDNFSKVDKSGKVSESKNPIADFVGGKGLSPNASRTQKRGARRNLQRYKLRRKTLIEILIKNGFIDKDTPLTEIGKNTTFQTLKLRAKGAREKIELADLARVLLAINKKRGYKSSRKASNEEEGQAIDGMSVAKTIYENNLTPGAYTLQLLKEGRKYLPDFYRSDLEQEFKTVWESQKAYYPELLSNTLFEELQGKNKSQTWAICQKPFDIVGIKQKGTAAEKRLQRYQWRVEALVQRLDLEHLANVLQDINNDLNKSSGYLGAISDRSKELYFNNETVGENLYKQLLKNPHTSLKNQVFYRQDYLDEFETIWETQSKYHSVLTDSLKKEIRDVVIFYQRRLKSQKGLISFCQFESREQKYVEKETGKEKTRTVGRKVIPKSSPLFQEFKIWQNLNHLELVNKEQQQNIVFKELDDEVKHDVFEELNVRGDLKPNDILKILSKHLKIGKVSEWKCNFEKIEGNRTNEKLYNIYQTIAENEGYGFDWAKKSAKAIKQELRTVFPEIGIDATILEFDSNKPGFDKQSSYQLWHLLYSAEEDDKIKEEDKLVYGNSSVALKKKLHLKYGFKPHYSGLLANITLQPDYGNLSSKAIRNILPYLKEGHMYSEACGLAGYNHSNSLTAEEQAKRLLKPSLELLKKNSLRNPVVEKILNQMVNVVNQVIETYGKPDEVRIELARELKKSAKERADMTKSIADATRRNEDIRKTITKTFGIPNPTKNDVVRYRLWKELEIRGFKDIFTNTQIKHEDLFSNKIDIEHIIPKALLFDDSFSNKTLAFKKDNLKKADRTAYDFIAEDYQQDLGNFEARVESLFKDGHISKAKRNKLLMPKSKLPDGFIERDLRNSQYIAKKAKQMLYEVFRTVISTSGSITDKLREDWDLINVMKELNLPKYRALGLTEMEERKNGKKVEVIKDWTKRNDHRHHAMDALTVAFTTHNHIQYLNNLNTYHSLRGDEVDLEKSKLYALKNTITKVYKDRNGNGKRKFIPPMPNFRVEAKDHIESILISFKNKNKVVAKNINKTRRNGKYHAMVQLTPRGQLHKETVYGKIKQPKAKATKLNKRFTLEQAHLIIDKNEREAVLAHLSKYGNNTERAFDTKVLKKQPLLYKGEPLKEVMCFEEIYTIRKEVTPDLKLDKVIDGKVRQVLKQRLEAYGNKPKEAFSDLEKNPIWLNESKGIQIKRVTIKGVSNAEPLHAAKDHLGNEILDGIGQSLPVDYVSTGNNHHVAIYEDKDGRLQEKVVSFYEAVARVNEGLPIIDKSYNTSIGWKFKFTMKQNEMFVFPNDDFDVNTIDFLDDKNARLINKHLFRVQKIATKNYFFRHHLETTVDTLKELSGIAYKPQLGLSGIEGIVKVRVNHIGQIVQVGEY
ncbi:type II CRISPR RNA-guided endonuclease Cas9 [Zobellia uliginosa]|uniref:type II CRISPR RNA-guided endonuclease Cas9 n=1 Tax=Zobellia uliginosa TaxID=143224 RepID=UPI0026E275FC|nr:type II CRISPR RNA-guided endonuclease Cas9 [Zobellia uliginosa]MDO6517282.1 type II CRISPR RNA-guided endonuclease Cas9 [Zobellia uliginosa]